MAGNGVYIAPGGIFPTVDDKRNGIIDDSNKGSYTMIQALDTPAPEPISDPEPIPDPPADPEVVITGSGETPVPSV